MKLLRFGAPGQERPGLLDDTGQIRDLSDHVADVAGPALNDATLDRLRALDPATLPLAPEAARIGACVGGVGKFICIGLNYSDHAEEAGMPIPTEPILFMKATSAIIGPNDDVIIPCLRASL